MPRLARLRYRVTLAEHRTRRGLTHAQVVESISRHLRESEDLGAGIDAQMVSKHERGVSHPVQMYRRQHSLLYEVPESELWVVDEAAVATAHHDRASPPQEPLRTMTPSVSDRSSTLHMFGTERSMIELAADRARRFTYRVDGTSAEVIERLREDVQRIALAYPQRPLNEFLSDLVETQNALFTLLDRPQTPGHGRDLYFLAGVASGLLAKVSHDLADPHAAMLQVRTALLGAHEADHEGLRSWLRGLQSLVSYWAGRHAESLRYAEMGVAQARGPRGATAVWLAASAARAQAALGDSSGAVASIHRAQDGWDDVQPDDMDALGGICSFNQSRGLYYAAEALAWLPGQAAQAESYALRAVEAFSDTGKPEWAFGDEAGAHASLAVARVHRRDIEGAEEALAPVLALEPAQRINGVLHSVRRVHEQVRSNGLAEEAANFTDHLEYFAAAPTSALPR